MKTIRELEKIMLLVAIAVMGVGLGLDIFWVGFLGALVAFLLSLRVIFPVVQGWFTQYLTAQERIFIPQIQALFQPDEFLNSGLDFHCSDGLPNFQSQKNPPAIAPV